MMFQGWGGSGTFIFWMVMDFIGAISIAKFAPETKGKTLEEIQLSGPSDQTNKNTTN